MKLQPLFILCVVVTALPRPLFAAEGPQGTVSAEVRAGLWLASNVRSLTASAGNVESEPGAAFQGGVGVDYCISDEFAVDLSLGIIAARINTHEEALHSSQESEFVVPLLIGLRYYSHAHTIDSTLHPYISVSVGPFAGLVSRDDTESKIVRSEVSFGGRIGGGIEKQIGDEFVLSLNGGLFLMSNYAGTIGGRRNFNGPEISIGFAILLGNDDSDE